MTAPGATGGLATRRGHAAAQQRLLLPAPELLPPRQAVARAFEVGLPVPDLDGQFEVLTREDADAVPLSEWFSASDIEEAAVGHIAAIESGLIDERGRLRQNAGPRPAPIEPETLDLETASARTLCHAALELDRRIAGAMRAGVATEQLQEQYPLRVRIFEVQRIRQSAVADRVVRLTRAKSMRGEARAARPHGQPGYDRRQSEEGGPELKAYLSDLLYRLSYGEVCPVPTILSAEALRVATIVRKGSPEEIVDQVDAVLAEVLPDRQFVDPVAHKLARAVRELRLGVRRKKGRARKPKSARRSTTRARRLAAKAAAFERLRRGGNNWRGRLAACAEDGRVKAAIAVALSLATMMPRDGRDLAGLTMGQLCALTRNFAGHAYSENTLRCILQVLRKYGVLDYWQPAAAEVPAWAVGVSGHAANVYRLDLSADRWYRAMQRWLKRKYRQQERREQKAADKAAREAEHDRVEERVDSADPATADLPAGQGALFDDGPWFAWPSRRDPPSS